MLVSVPSFKSKLIAGLVAFSPAIALADTPPMRVVSMNLCTDQLAMLVADEGQLLSVSRLAQDPEGSAMAEQAQTYLPNSGFAEEIYLMQPDLVIAGSFSTPATTAMLQRLGVPVVVFDYASSLSDIRDRLFQMGEVLGHQHRAAKIVADFDAQLAALQAEITTRPKAALYYANGYTSGDSTLAGQILIAAGFDNIATEAGLPYGGNMPLEVLALMQPDAIITSSPSATTSRAEDILTHPVVDTLRQKTGTGWSSDRDWACGTPFVLNAIADTAALRRQLEGNGS